MEVDNMTVASQVKQTIASLKGARGTLNMYTVQTSDDRTQSERHGDSPRVSLFFYDRKAFVSS